MDPNKYLEKIVLLSVIALRRNYILKIFQIVHVVKSSSVKERRKSAWWLDNGDGLYFFMRKRETLKKRVKILVGSPLGLCYCYHHFGTTFYLHHLFMVVHLCYLYHLLKRVFKKGGYFSMSSSSCYLYHLLIFPNFRRGIQKQDMYNVTETLNIFENNKTIDAWHLVKTI